MLTSVTIADHRIRGAHESEVRYGPIGRCIYCGDSDVLLSEEHIIPDGLGGNLILERASCAKCATITGNVEQNVLRVIMERARADLGIRSSKSIKAKRAGIEFVSLGFTADECKQSTNDMNIHLIPIPVSEKLPLIVPSFTTFGWPGILRANPSAPVLAGGVNVSPPDHWERVQRIIDQYAPSDSKVVIGVEVNYGLLAQMYAKIAHAYAVAVLGYDGFDHMLGEYSISPEPKPVNFQLIGAHGSEDSWLSLHDIKLIYARAANPDDDSTYVVCSIRLFSFWVGPSITLVVGKSRSVHLERAAPPDRA